MQLCCLVLYCPDRQEAQTHIQSSKIFPLPSLGFLSSFKIHRSFSVLFCFLVGVGRGSGKGSSYLHEQIIKSYLFDKNSRRQKKMKLKCWEVPATKE